MCLAILKPKHATPNYTNWKSGMHANSHGAGFAAVADGGLVVEKGFFEFDELREAFRPYEKCAALVHFRLATHGFKNKDNCHPFLMSEFVLGGGVMRDDPPSTDVAMIHNGIFFNANEDRFDKSDTWHVCRDVLAPQWVDYDEAFFQDGDFAKQFMLEYGGFNKLAFMNSNGEWSLWGSWIKEDDDCYYSNLSHKHFKCANPYNMI